MTGYIYIRTRILLLLSHQVNLCILWKARDGAAGCIHSTMMIAALAVVYVVVAAAHFGTRKRFVYSDECLEKGGYDRKKKTNLKCSMHICCTIIQASPVHML